MTVERGEPRFKLYYWPLPFRGCFITYLFAYRDVPLLIEDDLEENLRLKNIDPAEQATPYMGPPVLQDRDSGAVISQMPAIVLYGAEVLGLSPADSLARAMCTKVLMDCNDLLMEICRFNGSSMWRRKEWLAFRGQRFPRWLQIFEASLDRGMIGSSSRSFADIAVFALFGNMMRCLPELERDILEHAPAVHAHCLRLGSEASLSSYVADDEQAYGKTYCGGQIEQSIRSMLASDGE